MSSDIGDYFEFHGKQSSKRRTVDFNVPRRLVVLGRARAIEYECSKKHGGGDGTTAVYRHEFTTPMVLCMDERKGKQLYILGSKLKVTQAGVEH